MKRPLLLSSLLAGFAVFTAHAAKPWDLPFAADTAAIQRAASAIETPKDEVASILLDDYHYSIDKSGRVHYEIRQVYRILSSEANDSWATVEAGYQPWRGEKPQVRARVITKDGSIHWLDQKTLTDAPSVQFDGNIFSDDRVVRAPLPAIAIGSIVEYAISGDDAPGIPEMGVMRRISAGYSVAMERLHITVDAAKGAPAVQTDSALIPASAIRQGKAPGTVVEVELGPVPGNKGFEANLPSDVARSPWFGFSTGTTWSAIAARYSDVVDQKIQGSDLKSIMSDIDLTGPAPVVAARLAARLHREIRYTGVELGESAVIPTAPEEVIRRRYGDCKDKSALLVAMLRAAGLKAYVALLRTGPGLDVSGRTAGGDLFDHAIVYVASEPALWIDATASETRIGTLPTGDQGRLALIAMRGTTQLTKTSESTEAWERKTLDIRFADYGYGSITETTEGTNSTESGLRARYAEEAKTKEALEKYVKSSYSAKSLGKFSVTGRNDLGNPFVLTLEAKETSQIFTTDDGAKVELSPASVLSSLPGGLQPGNDDEDKPEPRKGDFYFPEAINTENVYLLHPPAFFRAGTLPAASELHYGPLTWSRNYVQETDGSVEVRYKLVSSKRRITAAEYEEVYKALHAPGVGQHDVILFSPVVAEYAATGQTAKAISMLSDDSAKHPENAGAHIRLSHLLLNSGMGLAARAEARKATEADPKSTQGWQALGWALQHDTFGRRFAGDWDLAESEKCYRKAMETDPDDQIAVVDLAILLEHNAHGVRYGRGAHMDDAIALYRSSLEKQPNTAIENNLTIALMMTGRIDEALEQTKKGTPNVKVAALYTTIHEGVGRAIVQLQSQFPDPTTRSQEMAAIGLGLMRLRRYDDARSMMTAASRSANAQKLAPLLQILSSMKKKEDLLLPESDHRSLPQRLMMEVLSGNPDAERIKKLMTPGIPMDGFAKSVDEINGGMAQVQRQLGSIGLSEENLTDLAMSMFAIKLDGDETRGYRAAGDVGPSPFVFYLAPVESDWRITGTSDSPEEVGKQVLDLLEHKKTEEAQWWLDKVVNDLKSGKAAVGQPIERELWSGVVPETRGATAIRRTAASLMARFSKSPRGMEILREEIAKTKDTTDLGQLYTALCEAYLHNEDWAQLATTAKTLQKYKLYEDRAFRYLAAVDRQQKQWKDLEDAATARQASRTTITVQVGRTGTPGAPGAVVPEHEVLSALVAARINQGNYDGAADAAAKLKIVYTEESREADAWIKVLSRKADEATLTEATRDQHLSVGPYTRAALQLTLDHADDARDSLGLAIGDSETADFDSRAWVIHGMIALNYGLKDEATASWQKAREAKNKVDAAEWSLALIPK